MSFLTGVGIALTAFFSKEVGRGLFVSRSSKEASPMKYEVDNSPMLQYDESKSEEIPGEGLRVLVLLSPKFGMEMLGGRGLEHCAIVDTLSKFSWSLLIKLKSEEEFSSSTLPRLNGKSAAIPNDCGSNEHCMEPGRLPLFIGVLEGSLLSKYSGES